MAINKKPHFRGNDYNNQELKDAKVFTTESRCSSSADEAVRKSQAEAIADQAAQDILVSLSGSASNCNCVYICIYGRFFEVTSKIIWRLILHRLLTYKS